MQEFSFATGEGSQWARPGKRSAWNIFYQEWWGQADKSLAAGSHLFISEITIAGEILEATNGHILVREEYRRMYDRLCGSRRGVVLTGQPGIGKSMSLIYFLVRRMTEKRTTFFSTDNVVYAVSSEGVFSALVDSIRREDMPKGGPVIWSLIDSNSGNHSPPSILSVFPLLPILATSPNELRYKEWRKTHKAVTWVMNLWAEDELKEGLEMQRDFSIASSEHREEFSNTLQQAIQQQGYSARDVYLAMFLPIQTQSSLNAAVKRLAGAKLTTLFKEDSSAANTTSHRIITLRRLQEGPNDDDVSGVDFKSEYIRDIVLNMHKVLEFEEARRLFELYRLSPETSSLGGWVFESMCSQILRSTVHTISRVPELVRMERIESRNCAHFSYTPGSVSGAHPLVVGAGNPDDTDLVDDDMDIGAEDILEDIPDKFPIFARETFIYDDIDQVQIDNFYYVPARGSKPLIDALCFSSISPDANGTAAKGKIIVWIFQMTKHGGPPKGYTEILSVRRKAETKAKEMSGDWGVSLRYVLVVPQAPIRRVEWYLPKEWSEKKAQGEVFCQRIPVSDDPL